MPDARGKVPGTLAERLADHGFTRRDLIKYCGALAVLWGLSTTAAPQIASALDARGRSGGLLPVIWMEGGSCSGCTEALAQHGSPDIPQLVLETISLNYSETFSAGAGCSMERARSQMVERGGYLLIYEGAVPTAFDGNMLVVGGVKGTDALVEAAERAEAVIALGSCACDGGWVAARPDDSRAVGVQKYLLEQGVRTPVVNIPCCPANPEWLVAVVVRYALFGTLPRLNGKNEPAAFFDQTVHDNCPRRGHFENGEFVYRFGSPEEAKGYCLYPLGCKGPQTFTSCPAVRWNRKVSWCIDAGAPCIGCGVVVDPLRPKQNWVDENAPFLKRHRDISLGDFHFQPPLAAMACTGLIVAALAIHGVGMKLSGRVDGGADFEPERRWDVKHGTEEAHEAGARAARLYDDLDELGLEPKNIDRIKKMRAARRGARHASDEVAKGDDE